MIACENKTWSLIKRKDLKGFARYLAEEFYDIWPNGEERTKSELLEFLSKADLKDYRLSHFRVTMLNQSAAIVTYHADAHAVIHGKLVTMNDCNSRLGKTWRQMVERVGCRFGAASTRFEITATSNSHHSKHSKDRSILSRSDSSPLGILRGVRGGAIWFTSVAGVSSHHLMAGQTAPFRDNLFIHQTLHIDLPTVGFAKNF